MNARSVLLLTALTLITAIAPAQARLTGRAKHGMVVSDSAVASKVGADILAKGGNAVDAAVATGFALAVIFPAAGNLGGGGFMLVRLKSGESVFIDYRETAPALATRDMYLGKDGNVVKDLSLIGHLACGVPGTVAGLWTAHSRYGKLPWNELVEPAQKLAEAGFEVGYELSKHLERDSKLFKRFPASWKAFCREGKFYDWGETLIQPDLARTLGRIEKDGMKDFYEGETAKLIVAEMRKGGGLIELDDLMKYRPTVRVPLKARYRGYDLLTSPPPSSGGVALIEMLNILEGYHLRAQGPNTAGAMHLMLEAMLRAFADRSAHLGDPDFVKVPVEALTDKKYAAALRAGIRPDKATPADAIRPTIRQAEEGTNTTHFSVVDAEGNAVANTYTLNSSFGSGVTVTGAGFLLNNEMDDFTSKPGVPNAFGLIQGEANAIAPNKRPLSSMTPTFVLKDGQLMIVLGSPGGPTIINTVMETILNVVEFGMTIQQAIDAPRFHHQWMPDRIDYEWNALNDDTRLLLQAMGYKFALKPASIGSCQGIFIDPSTGHRLAGVDRRVSSSGSAGH